MRYAAYRSNSRSNGRRKKIAEAFHADPSAADGKQRQNNKRPTHRPRAFMRVNLRATRLAHEGHVPEAGHIKRGQHRRQKTDSIENLAIDSLRKRRIEDCVFGKESSEGRNSSDSQNADSCDSKGWNWRLPHHDGIAWY